MLELAFTVYTQDETAYEIPGMLRVPLTTQLPYDIHITGNADAGFEVKQ
jgi:hypothetical protein